MQAEEEDRDGCDAEVRTTQTAASPSGSVTASPVFIGGMAVLGMAVLGAAYVVRIYPPLGLGLGLGLG